MINVEFEEPVIQINSDIIGDVLIHPEETIEPETVLIEIGWKTEGRGDEARGRIETLEFTPESIGPGTPLEQSFRATIPPVGPMSYDGKLIRVIWSVTVRIEMSWGGIMMLANRLPSVHWMRVKVIFE